MGNISITFADSENGLMTTTFNFSEADMKRMITVLKASYDNMAQKQHEIDMADFKAFMESEPDYEGGPGEAYPEPKLYVYTPKAVLEVLSEGLVQSIVDTVIDNEKAIMYKQMNIQPIVLKKQT